MSIPLIDLERLRTFYVSAKTGKFNLAAQELKVDNSTISRHIAALEEELGCALFERRGFTGLLLTEKGKTLYDLAHGIFEKVAQIGPSLKHTDEGFEGSLKIWVYNGVSLYFLNACLNEFAEKYPRICLEIISSPDFKEINLGEVDIAIGPLGALSSFVEKGRDAICHPLLTYELRLYAHKKYLEKHGTPQNVADLKNHSLISAASPATYFHSKVNWHSDLLTDMPLKPYLSSNITMVLEKFIKEGLGIGSLCRELVSIFFEGEEKSNIVEVLPDLKGPKLTISMAYPSSFEKSQKVRALHAFLKEKAHSFREDPNLSLTE